MENKTLIFILTYIAILLIYLFLYYLFLFICLFIYYRSYKSSMRVD